MSIASALKTAKPIAFLTTAAPETAKAFYTEVLGLTFVADEDYALVFELGSSSLRLAKVEAVQPPQGTALGWEVEDIATAMQALRAKGVSFEHFGLPYQAGDGIATYPDGVQVAWFKDPEGNLLSLTQLSD